MIVTVPDEPSDPQSWIGFAWLEADEDKLFADGQAWVDYGSKLRRTRNRPMPQARRWWPDNSGDSPSASASRARSASRTESSSSSSSGAYL